MNLMVMNALRLGSRVKISQFAGVPFVPTRTLFSREELGIPQFEYQRSIARNTTQGGVKEFMINFKLDDFNDLRLDDKREEIKRFLHIMNGTEIELELLKKLIIIYYDSFNNTVHKINDFVFGTPIMRLFYILNQPDNAIRMFTDSNLKPAFDQMQTYKVLLTLLYENKRYAELFELYSEIRKHLTLYESFPDKTINCLAFAVCFHLNTPEHYKYALELWKRTEKLLYIRRSKYFLAALALNQNDTKFALNLLEDNSAYVLERFLRLKAYTQSNEFHKALEVISLTIKVFRRQRDERRHMPFYSRQMLEELKQAIEKSGNESHLTEFNVIHQELESLGLLNDETLEDRLCATFPPMLSKNTFQKMKNKTSRTNYGALN